MKTLFAAVGLCLLGAVLGASTPALLVNQAEQEQTLPEGKGKQELERVCSGCHRPEQFLKGGRRSRAAWQQVVDEMIARGAKGSDEDFKLIVDYLTTHYGPKPR